MDEAGKRELAQAIEIRRKLAMLRRDLNNAHRFFQKLAQGLLDPAKFKFDGEWDRFPDIQELKEKIQFYQKLHAELEEIKRRVPPEVRELIEGQRPSC